jgi:ABC-type sugar transport system permease subunit
MTGYFMEQSSAELRAGPAIAAAVAPSRRPTTRDSLEAYGFLAPALLVLAVFLLAPAVWVFGLSLYHWDLIAQNPEFVGLDNFRILLTHDQTFRKALLQTLYYVVATVPIGMGLGLGIALLLNKGIRGQGFMRSAIFAPYVMPLVATAIIWGWMLNPDFGVIDAGLKALHLPPLQWLNSARTVMASIILFGLWQHVGYTAVIFLAGLANIPPELEEAARVDGARPWTAFWKITWPMLSPTTYFVLVISMIASFKVLLPVLILVGNSGGPDNAAETIGVYLYSQAFVSFHAGYAGAISVVLFVIILGITLLQTRVLAKRVFYQ